MERALLRSALGYAVRPKDALLRVFGEGRLVLDNDRSERALHGAIATGRKLCPALDYAEVSSDPRTISRQRVEARRAIHVASFGHPPAGKQSFEHAFRFRARRCAVLSGEPGLGKTTAIR
jgi:hypothetical protein